jgi:hypothetical protein
MYSRTRPDRPRVLETRALLKQDPFRRAVPCRGRAQKAGSEERTLLRPHRMRRHLWRPTALRSARRGAEPRVHALLGRCLSRLSGREVPRETGLAEAAPRRPLPAWDRRWDREAGEPSPWTFVIMHRRPQQRSAVRRASRCAPEPGDAWRRHGESVEITWRWELDGGGRRCGQHGSARGPRAGHGSGDIPGTMSTRNGATCHEARLALLSSHVDRSQ